MAVVAVAALIVIRLHLVFITELHLLVTAVAAVAQLHILLLLGELELEQVAALMA
jgi:hypothetical protein